MKTEYFSFSFTNKNHTDNYSLYTAIYPHDKNLLVKYRVVCGNNDFTGDAAWNIFYEHASFKEILAGKVHGSAAIKKQNDVKNRISCLLDDYNFKNVDEVYKFHCAFYDDENNLKISLGEPARKGIKKILETIRDNPSALEHGVAYSVFQNLMIGARYGNIEYAKQARDLLIEHLIPKYTGKGKYKGKLLSPYTRYDLAKDLLDKLAKHLSKEYKAATKKHPFEYKNNKDSKEKELQEWKTKWIEKIKHQTGKLSIVDFVDSDIHREEKPVDFNTLTSSPLSFVENFLQENLASPKTITRLSKKQ